MITTQELINKLMDNLIKYGNKPITGEMLITANNEPMMGKRVPVIIDCTENGVKFSFKFGGLTTTTQTKPEIVPVREVTEI